MACCSSISSTTAALCRPSRRCAGGHAPEGPLLARQLHRAPTRRAHPGLAPVQFWLLALILRRQFWQPLIFWWILFRLLQQPVLQPVLQLIPEQFVLTFTEQLQPFIALQPIQRRLQELLAQLLQRGKLLWQLQLSQQPGILWMMSA